MTTIPCKIPIYYQAWTEGQNDAHGNPVGGLADAVVRMVYDISQFGRRGSSHEIVDVDYLARVETVLEIGVPDPTIYFEKDVITLGVTSVDDSGNPLDGTAFHVESYPDDNRTGPLPLFSKLMGGAVRVRRVT